MVTSHRSALRQWVMQVSTQSLSVSALMLCAAASAQPLADIRLARYTSSAAAPEAAQLDPLEAIVQLTFPRSNVQTIGDAIGYLLLRSGYRLTPDPSMAQPARELLAMPLPEVHRRMGPYTVRTALSVLVGKPFAVTADASQRVVSYSTASVDATTGAVAKDMSRLHERGAR